jgi:hypothetical protein
MAYTLKPRRPIAGQNHNKKIANRSFESAAKFKRLWRLETDKNLIHDEIKIGKIRVMLVSVHSAV